MNYDYNIVYTSKQIECTKVIPCVRVEQERHEGDPVASAVHLK